MRVFVTGGSGWIGSAVVAELVANGDQVVGLARSEASAAKLTEAGAEVVLGTLEDHAVLAEAAASADGVAHLGYIHDFSDMAHAAAVDRGAIGAMAQAMAGSGKPLVITAGTAGALPGVVLTEEDVFDSGAHPRLATEAYVRELAGTGVRTAIIRCAPTVHGEGDKGFVPRLIQIAREKGVAGYVGDGANVWNAVHRLDAARLFRLALESAPPAATLHAVAEEGITTREIAEAFGRHLDLPVVSIDPAQATEHFGFLGLFWGMDLRASSALTQERYGWSPAQPGLLEDLEAGHYFREAVTA